MSSYWTIVRVFPDHALECEPDIWDLHYAGDAAKLFEDIISHYKKGSLNDYSYKRVFYGRTSMGDKVIVILKELQLMESY
jgi:hypothetical protein